MACVPNITVNKKNLGDKMPLFRMINSYIEYLFRNDIELIDYITNELLISPNDIDIEITFDKDKEMIGTVSFNIVFTIHTYHIQLGIARFIYLQYEDVFLISTKYAFISLVDILIKNNRKDKIQSVIKQIDNMRKAVNRETLYLPILGIQYNLKNYLELLINEKDGIGLADYLYNDLMQKCLNLSTYMNEEDEYENIKKDTLDLLDKLEEYINNDITY